MRRYAEDFARGFHVILTTVLTVFLQKRGLEAQRGKGEPGQEHRCENVGA